MSATEPHGKLRGWPGRAGRRAFAGCLCAKAQMDSAGLHAPEMGITVCRYADIAGAAGECRARYQSCTPTKHGLRRALIDRDFQLDSGNPEYCDHRILCGLCG